jgi:cytochrome P450
MTILPVSSPLPLPPGRHGLPWLGETLSFFKDPDFALKRHQQYGSVFKTYLLGRPTIFMRGSDANRFVLTGENQWFTISWPPSAQVLLGSGSLSMQTGEIHQKRRKLLAQAFLPRALSGYVATMEDLTRHYLHKWEGQRQLTWYPELRNYTFDIACKLLVGLDFGSSTRLGHLFEMWGKGLFSIPVPLPWTRFGRAQRSRLLLMQELEQIIQQRQQNFASGQDALSLLIQARDEDGNHLSLEELKDQILTLLFAGHETLTSAIASFCLLIAQHPEVMARLQAEQAQFASEPLTPDLLKQMTYLDQVLKEVLRLIAPVGGGFRQVIKPCEFNGYQIPQGWNLIYQIGSTHHDQTLYAQPDQFDPDRFSPERLQAQSIEQQKYGYVPFGGGIRECLGKEFARLEMKIFAAHLVRCYEWQLLPNQNLEMVAIPVPRPRDGLRVSLRRL